MRISTLVTALVSVAATSAVGGLAARPAVRSDWYAHLRKPAYQPPARVFPIVWPALYADVAVVSAAAIDGLSEAGAHDRRRAYQRALALNLLLNAGWSWLFFDRRRFGSATVLSAALTVSGVDLTRRAVRANGAGAVVLGLYPLWCAFATVLSGHIAVLNRGS